MCQDQNASFFSPPSWWRRFCFRALHALAVVFTMGGGDRAHADVLYDSTVFITDEGNWNPFFGATYIGGEAQYGKPQDTQGAEDFELADTYDITSVTADFKAFVGGVPPPADGVLVEFFAQIDDCSYDGGPCPSESPVAAVLSSTFSTITILPEIYGDSAFRLTVDLSSEGITLEPGIWWVSITPVDLTPKIGLATGWFNSIIGNFGANSHYREGGEDHGNGYDGLFGGVTDWTLKSIVGGAPDRDLALKIEGTLARSTCPADMDGDGSVGASDLLTLLAAWGTDPGGPPDLDGDGNVGASDLLTLLAAWGPCP